MEAYNSRHRSDTDFKNVYTSIEVNNFPAALQEAVVISLCTMSYGRKQDFISSLIAPLKFLPLVNIRINNKLMIECDEIISSKFLINLYAVD